MTPVPVAAATWIVAIIFGVMMGLIIGLRPGDRRVIAVTIQVIMAIGGIIWLTGPEPGSETAVAAVSMTLGGLASLAGLGLIGRLRAS